METNTELNQKRELLFYHQKVSSLGRDKINYLNLIISLLIMDQKLFFKLY